MNVDLSNQEKPNYTFVNPSNNAVANYELREITEEFQATEQNNYNARLDVTIPLAGANVDDHALKLGYRLRSKDKLRNNSFVEYEPIGAGFDDLTMVGTKDYSDSDFLAGPYQVG